MAKPTPVPRPEFSEAALLQLHEALHLYLSPSWDVNGEEALQHALNRVCLEAHAGKLGPERLVVAMKAAWAHLPVLDRGHPRTARAVLERLVGYSIETYYGERS